MRSALEPADWQRSGYRGTSSDAGRSRNANRSQSGWGAGLATSSGQRSRIGSRAASSRLGSRVSVIVQSTSSDEDEGSSSD